MIHTLWSLTDWNKLLIHYTYKTDDLNKDSKKWINSWFILVDLIIAHNCNKKHYFSSALKPAQYRVLAEIKFLKKNSNNRNHSIINDLLNANW